MKKASLLLPIIFLFSCEFLQKNFALESISKSPNDGKVRAYYPNGNLQSVCGYDENNKKHGECMTYFQNGNVKNKITYNHGEKIVGISHYEAGGPALEINYSNGKKNGLRTRYYEDGSIASQFEYKDNKPGKGLIEYSKKGELISSSYPKINIKPIDLIRTKGQYILEISVSKNPKRAEFYLGDLEDGKFLITSPRLIKLPESNKKGLYQVFVPKGQFRMEKLNFVVKYKTVRGNPLIIEKRYNLAVDNPY